MSRHKKILESHLLALKYNNLRFLNYGVTKPPIGHAIQVSKTFDYVTLTTAQRHIVKRYVYE